MKVINDCLQPGIVCIELAIQVPLENLKSKTKN